VNMPRNIAGCLTLVVLNIARHAQTSTNGTLRGRILDPAGLGVSSARVLLTNSSTGAESTASSDAEGSYQFVRLTPGRYRLVVEKPGFRNAMREAVDVAVNEVTVADMRLILGESAEFITVAGEADVVQSQRVEIAGRVDERRVRELPLNGENFAKLVMLAPGSPAAARITHALAEHDL
jgi:hypothetical protein